MIARKRAHALGISQCNTNRSRGRVVYSYDPLTFRLAWFKTTRASDSAKLQHVSYTYDAVGNIVSTLDEASLGVYFANPPSGPIPDPDNDYAYDAVYRLVKAIGREHEAIGGGSVQLDDNQRPIHNVKHAADPSGLREYTQEWIYDAVGNITQMKHTAGVSGSDSWTRDYFYESGNNRLDETTHGSGDKSYTHDAHGNMIGMAHLDGLDYDYADQLRHVDKQTGQDVYFVYDASGQRVRKVYEHDNLIEERIYLDGYELYRKWNGSDITTADLDTERETLHVSDDARRVCMIETLTWEEEEELTSSTPRYRFQLDNHLGTACVECDDSGAVISYEEYHPYGTSAYRAMASGVEVSAKRYRYTGRERDEETGLYYHGARYHAPWLGRWTQADPAGMVDGPGLYNYCRGSPVVLSDPSGTDSLLDALFPKPKLLEYRVGELKRDLAKIRTERQIFGTYEGRTLPRDEDRQKPIELSAPNPPEPGRVSQKLETLGSTVKGVARGAGEAAQAIGEVSLTAIKNRVVERYQQRASQGGLANKVAGVLDAAASVTPLSNAIESARAANQARAAGQPEESGALLFHTGLSLFAFGSLASGALGPPPSPALATAGGGAQVGAIASEGVAPLSLPFNILAASHDEGQAEEEPGPARGVGGKGWTGDATWRAQVRQVGRGGTIEAFGEVVASKQEALRLIQEAGGKVLRIEGPHDAPNPHTYPHINYTTGSGGRGTIRIQQL